MADSDLFDSDSDSDVSFFGFSREEIEESERRTENRRINFNADNSLDLSVDEYASSDTEADSASGDDETDAPINCFLDRGGGGRTPGN